MANEAICYEKPTKFARYTVNDSIGIAKGTVLKLVTANRATASGADNDPAAGIAVMEKVASDGSTEVSAALDGTWGLYMSTVSGVATVGSDVVIGATNNTLTRYTTLDKEKGYVYGKVLETVTGPVVAKVRLNIA